MKTFLLFGLSLVVACGGTLRIDDDDNDDAGGGADAGVDTGKADNVTPPRVPKLHRPTATPCDQVRPSTEPLARDGGAHQCQKHTDCTAGKNGRCVVLDGRFGTLSCTYDMCFVDSECAAGGVCACEGADRTDANACLKGNCRVDADCGGNYCSPSLGSCGHYSKPVGYFCHTQADECIDDSDCTKGDCRYEPVAGKWKCSTQECAG